ncbi:flagellar basal body P-ring formation chaperone FlgA [Pelagicoccus mobilis]|uniref:Flagellar basal body P-ring formation protein FlgA n=1 Tax=Pelagicoccus mobilis TaxID=415221 RepID=A0A934RVH4_9BACT|nr:flagellar basal body P-ring formation chaperone FlgA [Pelagicoccus mobilis]MBK1878455.1 flagellar basal body P-ring formation protein FlgA [Pelagicoccus mobilis]
MKTSVFLRLAFGLGLAIFIFASALRASLEDILAPLPVAEVTAVSVSSVRTAGAVPASREIAIFDSLPEVPSYPEDAILAVDVHEEITRELQAQLRTSGDLSLVPLRDLPDISEYSQPFSVNLVSVPNRLARGNVYLRYQVENEKGILGEWTVPFRVHLFSEVWFPKAHLRSGDLAVPSDFEIRQIDLLTEPDAVPASLESLMRHEYARDVMPGKPLQWRDLMERSLVRKGDVVEVTAVNGLLAISMRAVARQDGSDGDLILLRNIDSAKEFSARVIGENRVEVIF